MLQRAIDILFGEGNVDSNHDNGGCTELQVVLFPCYVHFQIFHDATFFKFQ